MIYHNLTKKLDDMSEIFGGEKNLFRMAKVVQLESGKPVIRFNGEAKNAQKKYKRLASYSPAVGDYIVLVKIAKTYLILGKVVE